MSQIKWCIKYAILTLKHKWFVFRIGVRLGVSFWRLLKHDWTKFMPSELPHYGRQFFGPSDDPAGFVQCVTQHQSRNEHHWEHWVLGRDNEPVRMPDQAMREMVADWYGASRAYKGVWPPFPLPGSPSSGWEWFDKKFPEMNLHVGTRRDIENLLYG